MDDTAPRPADDTPVSRASRAAPLPKPTIPAAADGGLGYDDILRIPEKSLTLYVGPWDGFEDDDTAAILVGNRIFGTAPASAADRFGSVEVLVPARLFSNLPDGMHEVKAQVTNQLGVPVESPVEMVYLKLTVPGGMDPVADTPYRNENLAAPAVEPLLIDKTTPSAQVRVPAWGAMSLDDRLILRWGVAGNEQSHVVSDAAQIGQPVTLTVERAMIDAGGVGQGVEVTYQIFDRVGNWSLFAPPTRVEVASPDALDAPWVDPTVDDLGAAIDVMAVPETGATAEVFNLQVGDVVSVTLEGMRADGSAVEPFTSAPQTATIAGRPLHFVLPKALFAPLVQGTCAVSYACQRQGQTFDSLRRRLEVRGVLQQLPTPSVNEAVGDVLDPANVPDGATALVAAHPLIVAGTRVTLTMYGTTTGGAPVGDEQFRDVGSNTPFPLPFIVPGQKIAALSGSTATFAYTVDTFDSSDGQRLRRRLVINALYPSPERTYRIGGVTQNLPPPVVPRADGDRLDPADVDDRIGVQVDVDTAAIVANDRVSLTWRGTRYTTPYTDTLTAHGSRVSFWVPKSPYVSGNDGGDVSVEYSVDGKGRSAALTLHVGAGLGELPPPSVDQAEGGQLDPVDAVAGLTVRVPTSVTLLPTDQVRARFGTYDTPTQPGSASPLVFTVPAAQVVPWLGKEVSVTYVVVRDAVPNPSHALSLRVGRFDNSDPRLPRPTILQAANGVVDLASFEGDATVAVAAWPLIAVDQCVWLEVSGTAGGQPRTLVLRNATPVQPAEIAAGVRSALARADLDTFDDGTALLVRAAVTFDGSTHRVDAILFPEQSYTISVPAKEFVVAFSQMPEGTLSDALIDLPNGVGKLAPQPHAGTQRSGFVYWDILPFGASEPRVNVLVHADIFGATDRQVTIFLSRPARYLRFIGHDAGEWSIYTADDELIYADQWIDYYPVLIEKWAVAPFTKIIIRSIPTRTSCIVEDITLRQ